MNVNPPSLLPRGRQPVLVQLAAFVVLVAGLSAAKALVVPFLMAAFLAALLTPPLFWLRGMGVPKLPAILLLVLLVVVVETGSAALVGTSLADFSRGLPQYQVRLGELTNEGIAWLAGHGIEVGDHVLVDQIKPERILALAAATLNRLGNFLTNSFMILIVLIFILLEAAGFPNKLRAIVGAELSPEAVRQITRGLNRYLIIKTLSSLVNGVCFFLLLSLLNVRYAAMWGVLAFVLNFVPTIGSIIASIPPLLLSLVEFGPGHALVTGFSMLAIDLGFSNIIEPRIMGMGVGLSPLVIFVSMAFWGWVLGPMGMLLSVPLTMTCKIGLSLHPHTLWVAVLLGTDEDATRVLQERGTPLAGSAASSESSTGT
ncbi:MAG: hypothetical protein BWK76_09590 [Desulfobulbaceae bacterium A2]|nr:MAG: hypothetical protein BWK76_09590 [Desulfobulbaceae bacterium A2]